MGGGGWLRSGQVMVGLLATGQVRCEVAGYRSGHGGKLLATSQVMVGGRWVLVRSWLEVAGCSRSGHGGRWLAQVRSWLEEAGYRSSHDGRWMDAGLVMVGGYWL